MTWIFCYLFKFPHSFIQAMKIRHWTRIANLTGHTFDVESDNFLLSNIMEAPILKYKEDIEVRFKEP